MSKIQFSKYPKTIPVATASHSLLVKSSVNLSYLNTSREADAEPLPPEPEQENLKSK